MSARSVLQVNPRQIQLLEDVELRNLMEALLWAEAVRCGANRSQVCVSHEMKAADDGCDGESPPHSGPTDWMPAEQTCWQLKAGAAGEPSALKGEVVKKIPHATLSAGGNYVVVASHASGPKQVQARLAILSDEAAAAGLPTDRIRVYDCERLTNWVNQFPTVAAQVAELPEGLFRIQEWERQEQFSGLYHASPAVAKQIKAAQCGLNFADGDVRHVHVVGPPGVGKTRLALEIARAPHLGPLLVYFDSFHPGVIEVLARVRAKPATLLLAVVDEASPDAIRRLHDQVNVADGRLRLITVGSAAPSESAGVSIITVAPLSHKEMALVVGDCAPQLPHEHVDFVVRFADGYVKLARLVSLSLSLEPDLRALKMLQQAGDMTRLLDRLLGEVSTQDRRCLHVPALLQQVGWADDLEAEGQAVAQCLGLHWLDVKQAVHGIHQRTGVAPLAGRLRYISPRPLALYLAIEALMVYPRQLRDLPSRLPNDSAREAFYDRLSELADFPAARRQCREELELFFSLGDLSDRYRARVWSNLALTETSYAATQLRHILEHASHDEKLAFRNGRREVVGTLVKLAWPRASFRDAMLALAELAVAENENFANNATGEFVERYQVVLGGTAVPYLDRLAVLEELLQRPDLAYHRLVVRALGTVARFHESRMRGGEDHGTRTVEEEWHPTTPQEEGDVRREALRRLVALVHQGDPALEQDLVDVVSECLGPLVHAHYAGGLQDLLLPLMQRFPAHREKFRVQVAELMDAWGSRDTGVPHPEFPLLRQLHDALVDPSLEGRLRQYVGQPRWIGGDCSAELSQLVSEFLAAPDQLRKHFGWLTSGQAGNAWAFGELLGERDAEGNVRSVLLTRDGRGQDLAFVTAYLVGQSRHQQNEWLNDWLDGELCRVDSDDALILDATWRAGPSIRGVRRCLKLLDSRRLSPDAFWCLRYGRWPLDLTVESFGDLVAALASLPPLRPLALQLLVSRLHHHPGLSGRAQSVAAELVTDPQLVHVERGHGWAKVATEFVHSMSSDIARTLFMAHQPSESWFMRHSYGTTVLMECVAHDPQGTWNELRPILENADRVRLFTIGFPRGVVEQLPRNALLEWAAGSVPDRPCLLARLAAPTYEKDDSLSSQLAETYADDTDVCSSLFANVISGMHSGSSADHWAGKAQSLDETAGKTGLPGLRRWATNAAASLREMAARDRVQEAEEELRY